MNHQQTELVEWYGYFKVIGPEDKEIEELYIIDLYPDDYTQQDIEEDMLSLALVEAQGRGYDFHLHNVIQSGDIRQVK